MGWMKWTNTRREFLKTSALGGAAAALGAKLPFGGQARAATLEGPVNVLSWGSGNSQIQLGGGHHDDSGGVGALWVPKFYQEGVIEVFDFEKMPEYQDLFDEFKK